MYHIYAGKASIEQFQFYGDESFKSTDIHFSFLFSAIFPIIISYSFDQHSRI